jgi:hypothetical protein
MQPGSHEDHLAAIGLEMPVGSDHERHGPGDLGHP